MSDHVDPTQGSGGHPGVGWMGGKSYTSGDGKTEFASPADAAASVSNMPQYFTPKNPPLPGIKAAANGGPTENASIPSGTVAEGRSALPSTPDVNKGTGDGSKPPMEDPVTKKRAPIAKATPGSAVTG